jgi:hypothetical protein
MRRKVFIIGTAIAVLTAVAAIVRRRRRCY